MSAKRTPSDTGRGAAGQLPTRIGSAHDPAEPLPPGTQRYLDPAARQQQMASDGGSRQPGGQETRREQYGQQGSGAGQPSQFGGVPSQQHAGHAPGGSGGDGAPRSGGTQDPRHAEEDDYAAPWGVYGGEYGQFDRSPGRRQAFGEQDLGFGPEGAAQGGRRDEGAGPYGDPDADPQAGRRRGQEHHHQGPGASQPWRGDDERTRWGGRGEPSGGPGSGQPYAPGQYGASPEGGPRRHGGDHDSQGSQDWQGYSGGQGWQPGPRGGWGGPSAGGYGGAGGQGTGYGGKPGSPGGYGGQRHAEPWSQGRQQGPRGGEQRWSQASGRGGWPGADGGPPVRDPSHDWGTRDAQPWGSRHPADDDQGWSGAPGGGHERSFDNPYGRRDGSGGPPFNPQLGEHQGSPYAGSRRGGIGSRASGGAGAQGGWDPSEHHGGRYGAQGFGASGHGGAGWSTPPGAGQPDNRPWDEQRGRHAESGPASWQAESRGSGWRSEPGSGPSGDRDDWRGGPGRWHGDDEARRRGAGAFPGGSGGQQGQQGQQRAHDAHGPHDLHGSHDSHRGHHPHDPDYHQWRAEQLKNFDDDYRQWRQERYRRFSDEFNDWRQGRGSRGGPSAGSGQTQGASTGLDTAPGGAQGSTAGPAGLRPESASAGTPGSGQPGSAHDVGVSGSTHEGSKADPQGAAQGRTLPSAGGESRDTTGTSGGPGQPAPSARDAGKAGKGKER